MDRFKKFHNEKVYISLITIAAAALYISLIFNSNVWMDEAFTAKLVHTSFIGVLYQSMLDTLPPLYNIILKIMTDIFGYTIPVMKLTSVIPMILTMLLGATVVRRRFGFTTAAAFIICITGMPLMFYYGVEIRMYSLGFFFATASGIYAHEVLCESTRRNWICFTVFSVLAGYSHHFAFVAVGFVYLFLLLHYFFADRSHIIRWFKCLGATFVLYLPCLVITLKQLSRVSGYFSMPDIDLHLFLQYVLYPYMVGVLPASVICLLLMSALLIFFALRFIKGSDRSGASVFSICCFCVYYGVLLFGTLVSKIMTANIFVDRYLFFSTGLLWLFAAIQIGKLTESFKKPYIMYAAFALLIFVGLCSYKVELNTEYSNSGDEEIAYLAENVKSGDIFFDLGGHEEMQNCLPFYALLNENETGLVVVYPFENALKCRADEPQRTLWISVMDGYELSDEENALLDKYDSRLEKAADFDFDRYKCTLYRVVDRESLH